MTIQYTIVFFLLILELLFYFTVLVLPKKWVRGVISRVSFSARPSERPAFLKYFSYATLVLFILVGILFFESTQEMNKYHDMFTNKTFDGLTELEVRRKEFYAQRNFYLCGFTLFVSLASYMHTALIVEVEDLRQLTKSK